MKKYLLLTLTLFLLACNAKEEQGVETPNAQLVVLFSPYGLGDMGYYDNILIGLQTVRKERGEMESYFYTPENMEEAERIFSDWLSAETNGQLSLFVLTTHDYEELASKCLQDMHQLPEGKSVLLFESRNPDGLPVSYFQISMYGASYLAGVTAANCTLGQPLIVLGNSNDASVWHAADGFEDGYISQTDAETVAVQALADDWSGYAKASETYQVMNEWTKNYGFIYSVAGGSNAGIYRYLREYPHGIYTAGMDTDQSALCSQIVGSMVKRIDLLIEDFIIQWLDTGTMPEQTMYGLESGYVDWVLAPSYKDAFQKIVKKERDTAIQKEKEYENAL